MNTMSDPYVIQRLTELAKPDEAAIASILGVELVQTKERAYTRILQAPTPPEPYERVELRLSKSEPSGLLVLDVAEDQIIDGDALVLPDYGEPTIDMNPRVPPEGETTQTFTVGDVALSFAATATSRQLRYVALQWGE